MSVDKILSNIDEVEVELNKDLTKYSTMKLVSSGDLVTVKSVAALKNVLAVFKENKITYQVLGLGANQLLKKEYDTPFILLSFEFDKESLDPDASTYQLPASIKLSTLTSFASKNGLVGWEVFTGIPATLGGAVFMNAGTGLGEIGELIKDVTMISKDGDERVVEINESSFSYRKNNFTAPGDVIVSATMINKGKDPKITEVIKNYLAKRNASQPMWANTCGCVFKNSSFQGDPCPAGKFVDIIGLKGLQVNGIRVSSVHGNFMENWDGASYDDVVKLIEILKDEMALQTGVKFELEAKV
jgi:UDP-N-acetylmuramate dehydrogenase